MKTTCSCGATFEGNDFSVCAISDFLKMHEKCIPVPQEEPVKYGKVLSKALEDVGQKPDATFTFERFKFPIVKYMTPPQEGDVYQCYKQKEKP